MLSPNELEVMDLLWSTGQTLSRNEIIDLSPSRTWKPSTIHQLLNSLLKKEVIKVDGFRPSGKVYGRTYAAAITREEYTAQVVSRRMSKTADTKPDLAGVFAALVSDIPVGDAVLDELQRILDQKKGKGNT